MWKLLDLFKTVAVVDHFQNSKLRKKCKWLMTNQYILKSDLKQSWMCR